MTICSILVLKKMTLNLGAVACQKQASLEAYAVLNKRHLCRLIAENHEAVGACTRL